MCHLSSTHHLNVRWNSGEKVQQLVVVDHVRVAQLLGELIHTCRNERDAVSIQPGRPIAAVDSRAHPTPAPGIAAV